MPAEPDGGFSLRIERSFAGLQQLAGWVDDVAAALRLQARAEYALRLCAEEAAANAVMHGVGCGDAADVVTLRAAPCPDGVCLTIEDRCAAFDPLAVAAPDLPRSLETAKVGGMGIYLMREQARSLRYERLEGVNRLTVTIARSHAGRRKG